MDYFNVAKNMQRKLDDFMTSDSKTICFLCGGEVFPQDEWTGEPEYNVEENKFKFPKLISHDYCRVTV